MECQPTAIDGLYIIQPRIFEDSRGYFFESFSQKEFNRVLGPHLTEEIRFVQDNESMSSYALHGCIPNSAKTSAKPCFNLQPAIQN